MQRATRLGRVLIVGGFVVFIAAGIGTAIALFRLEGPQTEVPADVAPAIPEPKNPVVTLKEKAVNEAVARAAAYLKKRVLDGKVPGSSGDAPFADTRVGAAALLGLALLEAGLPADDPAVKSALVDVRGQYEKLRTVYVMATAILFLNRLHEADPAAKSRRSDRLIVRRLALRLIAAQLPIGQWSYSGPLLDAAGEEALLEMLRGGTYKPSSPVDTYPSNGLTQFALLALWSSRAEVPVRAPLLHAARYFHGSQLADGAWSYNNERWRGVLPDSNTCAGLLALALEQVLRHDREFTAEGGAVPEPHPGSAEMQRKGLARLGKVIGRKKGDPDAYPAGKLFGAAAHGDCYFLWALERVAVIYGLGTIENKDWYEWGCQALLPAQRPDGSWDDRFEPALDTAFALLFLKRANLAKDLTDKLQELLRVEAPVPRKE